jgi:hypothetical protein
LEQATGLAVSVASAQEPDKSVLAGSKPTWPVFFASTDFYDLLLEEIGKNE